MAVGTKIEWTDATWSPVTGCTKVSPGCDHCYAETITNRFKRHAFDEVQLHEDRLEEPLKWRTPRRIFVCSMGDLFHDDVSFWFIIRVFETMAIAHRHTFQVLTKRPGRMAYFAENIKEFSSHAWTDTWPSNVWAGTSVESEQYLPRLDVLARVPAKVRFVSYEPALGPVDFRPWLWCTRCYKEEWQSAQGIPCPHKCLSWVIAGGESGPGARPAHPDWFRAVRGQCQATGVPFFFEQWGRWAEPVGLPVGNVRQLRMVDLAGEFLPLDAPVGTPGAAFLTPLRKKDAGTLLDGREWMEMPDAL